MYIGTKKGMFTHRTVLENMFKKIDNFVTANRANTILWVFILLLLLLGIHNRFIQDDAFISFRYAENFVSGHGLTWNIGEQKPIEGYTNFLWVIMIALVAALGVDPVLGSMVLGFSFSVGTMFFTYRLSLKLLQSYSLALLAVFLVGTNYSFSSYMTGGLETQLQTFLFVICTYFSLCIVHYEKCLGRLWLAGLSVMFACAVMTRIDSALIVCILWFFNISSFQRGTALKEQIVRMSCLTIPGLIIVGAWFLFKVSYYGDILPNTYYIKATDASLARGLWYAWSFLRNYSLIIFIFLGFLHLKKIFSQPYLRVLLVIVSFWCLYTIKVGGDFMEYRFFVPILPFIFILISVIIFIINNTKVQASLIVLLLVSSLSHAVSFEYSKGIESVTVLKNHVIGEPENWQRVGIVLGEIFSKSAEPVIIATYPAGAIPYYSKLLTIDMLGLNDRWIAKNGIKVVARPGHTRSAPFEYLLKSDVNLVLANPRVVSISKIPPLNPSVFALLLGIDFDASLLPDTSKIIDIPLNANYKIQVLYLKEHQYINESIKRLNLKTYEFELPL